MKFFTAPRLGGWIALAGLVGLLSMTASAQAPNSQGHGILLRIAPSDLAGFNARHHTAALALADGQDLYWVLANDSRTNAELLSQATSDSATLAAEENFDVSFDDQSTVSVLNQSTVSVLNQSTVSVLNSAEVDYYGTPAASGYVNQPAVSQIDATKAHQLATGKNVVVAMIDNGVDPLDPTLRDVLMAGYNFYDHTGNWSCYADLQASDYDDQSTVSVLNDAAAVDDGDFDDQSTVSVLNDISMDTLDDGSDDQSTVSVLNDAQFDDGSDDQSTVSVLNGATVTSADIDFFKLLKIYPEIGHGTAVAGLVHLVAPKAGLMELKAFSPEGTADVAAIVSAIYYAVAHGANIINMSFSATAGSPELQDAISYAYSHNVVLVAAAGNDGKTESLYPASYAGVLAVAALNPNNTLAAFSNFGPPVVVGAPGFDVISTYPDNHWAAVAGTSFSAPLVAGEAALVWQNVHSEFLTDVLILLTANSQVPADAHQAIGFGLIQVDRALGPNLPGGNPPGGKQ